MEEACVFKSQLFCSFLVSFCGLRLSFSPASLSALSDAGCILLFYGFRFQPFQEKLLLVKIQHFLIFAAS